MKEGGASATWRSQRGGQADDGRGRAVWRGAWDGEAEIDAEPRLCHTIGMKVAVSIPDPVFAEAEELAREWGTTRSRLYARALSEFVGAHAPDRVTQALNEGLDDNDESREFRHAAAKRVFDHLEW